MKGIGRGMFLLGCILGGTAGFVAMDGNEVSAIRFTLAAAVAMLGALYCQREAA